MQKKIAVIGLGYVGLPTALAFYGAGFSVTGIDVSKRVVELLRNGKSPLIDASEELEIPINDGRWKISEDFSNSGQYLQKDWVQKDTGEMVPAKRRHLGD